MKKAGYFENHLRTKTLTFLSATALLMISCGSPAPEPSASKEDEPASTAPPIDSKKENIYKPFTWLSDTDCLHPTGAKLDRSLGVHVNIPSKDIAAHNFVKGSGDTLYLELITTDAAAAYHPSNAKDISSGTSTLLLTAHDLQPKDAVELLNKDGDLPVLVFLIDNESTDPSEVRIGRKLKGKGWVTRNF